MVKICFLRDLSEKKKSQSIFTQMLIIIYSEKNGKKRIEEPHQTPEESGNGGIGSNKLKKKHEECQLD